MNPPEPNIVALPPDCLAFEQTVQSVLDGDLAEDRLVDAHSLVCPRCQAQARSVEILLTALRQPARPKSPTLNQRLVHSLMRESRRRRRRPQLLRAYLVLGSVSAIVTSIWLLGRGTEGNTTTLKQEIVQKAPAPAPRSSVSDPVREAGETVARITGRVAEEGRQTSQALVASPVSTMLTPVEVGVRMDPATESLQHVPASAKAGFEPVTNTTRRAVNLFLRDVNIDVRPGPRS